MQSRTRLKGLFSVTVHVIVENTGNRAELDNKVPPRWLRVKGSLPTSVGARNSA